MINTIAMTKKLKLIENEPINRLKNEEIQWYWVDFEEPNKDEEELLSDFFNFNKFAIEDCLNHMERPKVDYYDTYDFFVLNAIKQGSFEPVEVNVFIGKNYIVTFHKVKVKEIDEVMKKIIGKKDIKEFTPSYILYSILDNIVDTYFPDVWKIENRLNEISFNSETIKKDVLIDEVFDIAANLLKQRYIVNAMKEILNKTIHSSNLVEFIDSRIHFNDIYDHLLKLSDIIESNRELTSEIKDNYMSINSYKMNKIMTILTIITTIFIPLTFIAGVYGMNFQYMPELSWRYGYFVIVGIMLLMGIYLFLWFKRKGWFD